MTKLIKVDFSHRGKNLYYMNRERKEEKQEKRIEYRIERLIANG